MSHINLGSSQVGLTLAGAELLGRLDDLQGRHAGREISMVISAFVYVVHDPPPLAPNYEVASSFWFPVDALEDPDRHVHYHARHRDGNRVRYPGILVGEPERHVVWGLTYRFLENFFEIVERPLPGRWHEIASLGV